MSWSVAFRADADARIGAGHFMRCLTLAEGCIAKGGRPVLFTSTTVGGLQDRARTAGVEVVEIRQESSPAGRSELIDWVSEHPGAWVVVDGYEFESDLHVSLKQAGGRVMAIDDYPRLPYYDAEILLDQNFEGENHQYPVAPGCRTLLGVRYALLRPEFVAVRQEGRDHPSQAHRILVTMGAADPQNLTSVVVEALAGSDFFDLDVTVVIGSANLHAASVAAAAEKAGFRVERDVGVMAGLMAEADIAISSAGTTLWELCCVGLPTVTLEIADNQRHSAEALAQAGVTVNLGWYESVTPELVRETVGPLISDRSARETMSRAGQELVDGTGVERVVAAMLEPND